MCGIVGFIDAHRSRDSAELLIDRMCQVIRHRGPDDQGTWIGDGAALGVRRLSIIDRRGGHQPVFNEDGSILIVFNGEIYNYRELQKSLEERGHAFATNCDTEAIVHAYEEYGDDCVKQLRGMFAFALWDGRRKRLLAARDRFGEKPLHYYWDGQRLVFGSEIKALLEAGIPREISPRALDEYLVYRYVPTPHTLFKHVFKLPAAHVLTHENGRVTIKRYWELSFAPRCADDEATAIERTRALLEEAVRVRLMSEVPLGALLSGGLDSSLVVALMSRVTREPVRTFSIGFGEEDTDELPYARRVAQRFGTDHREFIVRPDLLSTLPQLVWAYDEPFADSSQLSTYYICKLAREQVAVVLTGDGGDEIFGGYARYQRELSNARIPAPVRSLLGRVGMLLPPGMRGKGRLGGMRLDLPARYLQNIISFPRATRPSMYDQQFFSYVRESDPYERLLSQFRAAGQLDCAASMQHVDVETYLADDILVKVDKASMFNSLEARTPFLDHHLAEYVASLHSAIRLRGGVPKSLLKQVAADLLPAEIVTRPKRGFELPTRAWLQGDLATYAHDLLDSQRARQRGIFHPQFMRDLLKDPADARRGHHREAIWGLICLELWFQVYMDPPPTSVGERSGHT